MTCSEDTCVIDGIDYLTMSDINEYYNLVDKYNASVNVVNSDGDLLDTILNDYKITFEDSGSPSIVLSFTRINFSVFKSGSISINL